MPDEQTVLIVTQPFDVTADGVGTWCRWARSNGGHRSLVRCSGFRVWPGGGYRAGAVSQGP